MRKYWWVNHNKTSKQEIRGGYLWSPKQNTNGAFNKFYSNMRAASPGDYVLSFADGIITFMGEVTSSAMTSPKPEEFGAAGSTWAAEGWLLPVQWTKLNSPIRPKNFIDELAPLLPPKYSPLKATGGGNEMYLAEVSFSLFQLVLAKAGVDLDLAMSVPELAEIFGEYSEQLDDAIERQIATSPALSSTEKSQLIKARRGQGAFRKNVQCIEKNCRLTGINNPYLLIASHIKPWRACTDSHERLDGNNGLLLTPHVDLLFDRGYISFSDEGKLLVSSKMAVSDLGKLGLNPDDLIPHRFSVQQAVYLDYHRSNVFLYVPKPKSSRGRSLAKTNE